jgi:hypothetical protein
MMEFMKWAGAGDNIWTVVLIGGAISGIVYAGGDALAKIIKATRRR